ncbi:MAG: hypothetical protein HY879_10355 [Deltaproteobacteria bacterium]|nr:hypothetical protein [Deltaproteobacteria bacterium]
MMAKENRPGPLSKEEVSALLKEANRALKGKLSEFQRTETVDLPNVLPPAEELQELKMLTEWCLKLWEEHNGFIFKPGPYYNE